MKGKIGIFLAGALTAFLFDPTSGTERRGRVGGWLAPARQRLMGLKDRVTARGGNGAAQSAAPGLLHTLEHVARRVQGRIDDASEMVGSPPPEAGQSQPAQSGQASQPVQGEQQTQTGQQAQPMSRPASTGVPQGATRTADTGTRPVTPADVAPTGQFDPIPEGDLDERNPYETINDPTLVARVESELYRDDAIPKGKLNIDAVHGVVTFRGMVDDETADEILDRARAIEGVHEVVDMLQRD